MKNSQTSKVTFTPLGGLRQIGANMSLWEDEKNGFIIDCGIMFPNEDSFGVDYLICDFKNLDKEKFKDLIITHAHEDHIGAVNHLLEFHPKLTVWANPLVQQFLKRKHPQLFSGITTVRTITPEIAIQLGSFHLVPFVVPHSVPDSLNFIIKHDEQEYAWIYSTDFKVKSNSTEGDWKEASYPYEFVKSQTFQKRLVSLVDSTNALVPGSTPSEQELKAAIRSLFQSQGRIFITLFSSNLIRLKNIISLGIQEQRRIIPVGRSVWNAIAIAQECDFLAKNLPLYDEEALNDAEIQDPNNLFIVSGCQGEIRSAVHRVASGQDGKLKLKVGDRFVFSSKTIPGNENKLGFIQNKIAESGATIITAHDEMIHASGHPAQDDLRSYFENLLPSVVIPIHGETWYLQRMTEFAKRINPDTKTYFMLNGQSLVFSSQNIELDFGIHHGLDPVAYHGRKIPISKTQINVRRKIASMGVILCSWNRRNLVLSLLGLPEFLSEAKARKAEEFLGWILDESGHNKDTPESLSEKLRIKIRQSYELILGYRPIVEVHFHE
ncbi:MAG: ribonuclease J [Bacteriovoracaceae bacterium]|nr:ribonuclease J [Bacteriovoracaceae bacterium]